MIKNSKFLALSLTVLLLCTIVLTSCGSSGIAGTWAGDTGFGEIKYEFKSNGTVVATIWGFSVEGKYTVSGEKIEIDFDGSISTATVSGKTMTVDEDGMQYVLTKK